MIRALPLLPPDEPGWHRKAACAFEPVGRWFPEGKDVDRERAAAVAVCERCEVRAECLREAMAHEVGLRGYARYGIYGGLTEKERARLEKEHNERKSVA